TGGYMPLAATLATERIYEAFLGEYEEFKTFFHGHTYTGNPLGCAIALANLDLFENERLIDRLQSKIALFVELLEGLKVHPHVGEIRQCGVMVGVELVQDKASKEPYPLTDRIGHKVCMEMRKGGIILRPLGNVIVMMPPLSIREDELKLMVTTAGQAIGTVCCRQDLTP
ncbi:MAG: aminotransferase class III-fold pyridoxal phosphate-dependent enzyme, partial [Nitrospirota bacterium]|nr:aminotransferase class III-fold pyridoxal phosphate-dependent enzyme [Nitrospirota bacterium]